MHIAFTADFPDKNRGRRGHRGAATPSPASTRLAPPTGGTTPYLAEVPLKDGNFPSSPSRRTWEIASGNGI